MNTKWKWLGDVYEEGYSSKIPTRNEIAESLGQWTPTSRFRPVSVQDRRRRGYKCGNALRAKALITRLEKEGKI